MDGIKKLMTFVDFLSSFAGIQRSNKIKGKEGFENDAEHSYQLALVAWYLVDALKLEVNKQRVLEYALAHDLVETYAGDTDTFLNNSEQHAESKRVREEEARQKIMRTFPEHTSLHETIERFEHLHDTEARLVYMVDKLLPDINIFLSNDTYYQDNKVTYEAWESWLRSKIEKCNIQDPEVLSLIDQLIQFQKDNGVFYTIL